MTETRINEHLHEEETAVIRPVCELASINDRLDAVGIPRNYPGSDIPCTTRERVGILVNLCLLKGIAWNGELEEVY